MARVKTNDTNLAYNIEKELGVTTPLSENGEWMNLEPNSVSAFGATVTKTARTPITADRQRRKGATTDLDSTVDFEHDITLSVVRDFVEGFVGAGGTNSAVIDLDIASVSNSGITLASSLPTSESSRFGYSANSRAALVYISGRNTASNNGLKEIDGASTGATLQIDSVATEAGAGGRLSLVGLRLMGSTAATWSYNQTTGTATLTRASGFTDLIEARSGNTVVRRASLYPGQFIHIGSFNDDGDLQNGFGTSGEIGGFARVVSMTSGALMLDKLSDELASALTARANQDFDILFGDFIRNVPVSSNEYLERSYTFEQFLPNLGDGSSPNDDTDSYRYACGNYCNTMALNLPLTDKSVVTFGFIGTDTLNPTTTQKDQTARLNKYQVGNNSQTSENPEYTEAFNTTADIARLRVADVDGAGLSTYFKSVTITLNNNVSPEKVLGRLGALYMNTGIFEVSIEAQLIFTNPRVIDAIRDNDTVSLDFVVANDDGAIVFDIPAATLEGGGLELPVNESVLINTPAQAFKDPTLGTSIGVSIFPLPMPVPEMGKNA